MRPIDRIDKFTKALNYIWKSKVPDWRFGQLFINVFDSNEFSAFHMEEDECLEVLCKYFDLDVNEVLKEIENDKCSGEIDDREEARRSYGRIFGVNEDPNDIVTEWAINELRKF